MDKSSFIQALEARLQSRIQNAEKFWKDEIRRQKEMKDQPSWKEWLKEQRDKTVEESESVMNGPDKYYSREDPAQNAQIFANLVEFDTLTHDQETDQWVKGTVDWKQLWDAALPFVSNVEARQDPNWKWRANFKFLLKVMDTAQKAKLFTEQIVESEIGYPLKSERFDLEECKVFFRGIINRGPAYFEVWEDYKLLFGDENLPEERFLKADIAFCEDKIEECKRKIEQAQHSKTKDELTDIIALFRERIRAYQERLEELRKGIQPVIKRMEPSTLSDLFSSPDAQSVAFEIGRKIGILNERNVLMKGVRIGVCVVFWDTLKNVAIHLLNTNIDDDAAYRMLSQAWAGKEISSRATRDHPRYADKLRRKITACLPS